MRNPNPHCKHCEDMHDSFYGSYAEPCPDHNEDGSDKQKPKPKVVHEPYYEVIVRRGNLFEVNKFPLLSIRASQQKLVGAETQEMMQRLEHRLENES